MYMNKVYILFVNNNNNYKILLIVFNIYFKRYKSNYKKK